MTRLTTIRLVLAAAGLAVFGYGARADQERTRLVGMIITAMALALRLLPTAVQARIDRRPLDEPGDRR
jgi:hypothetical protein